MDAQTLDEQLALIDQWTLMMPAMERTLLLGRLLMRQQPHDVQFLLTVREPQSISKSKKKNKKKQQDR